MNSSQVSILKQRYKVSLSSLLKCHNRRWLESKIRLRYCQHSTSLTNYPPHLEVLSNFTNKTLEWQFANQQLSRLLVPPDFTQCNCSRAESMRLLHSTSYSLHPISVHPISSSKNNQLTAVLRAAEDFVASCLRGALPPVDLRAVCLVRAITKRQSVRVTVTTNCTFSQIHRTALAIYGRGATRTWLSWHQQTESWHSHCLGPINKPRVYIH